jgi:DNA-3-methyladenine glycosylase I
MQKTRCSWVSKGECYQEYHDTAWGRAVLDSQEFFAKHCLDGQQAGLSWITILKKQANYEAAFLNFDPVKISTFTKEDVERLMQNAGIVRNRLKIQSIIKNAKAYLRIKASGISFSDYIWSFVDGKTVINKWSTKLMCLLQLHNQIRWQKSLRSRGYHL